MRISVADSEIVLLPPRTAQVYAYLLGQEKRELSKSTDASWERVLHIRHLKDRMLRTCISTNLC
jgi:hypothetical protein